jgi:hypothetical protein
MKNKQNDGLQCECLIKGLSRQVIPGVWLAVCLGLCAFPAGKASAQVVVDSAGGNLNNSSQVKNSLEDLGYFLVPPNVSSNNATAISGTGASADASSSITSQVLILPLQFSVTTSASAGSEINGISGYTARGTGGSAFVVRFHVTAPVRFNLTASTALTVNKHDFPGLSARSDVFLSKSTGGGGNVFDFNNILQASGTETLSTNISGTLSPGTSYGLGESTGVAVQSETYPVLQSGNAQCNYLMTFDPLPAGPNHILAGLLSGGDMRLTYVGIAGTNYALDRTFNLSPPVNWLPQGTNPADSSGVLIFTNTPNPATNNFWRIRSVP